jgi:hypothetical protein
MSSQRFLFRLSLGMVVSAVFVLAGGCVQSSQTGSAQPAALQLDGRLRDGIRQVGWCYVTGQGGCAQRYDP